MCLFNDVVFAFVGECRFFGGVGGGVWGGDVRMADDGHAPTSHDP